MAKDRCCGQIRIVPHMAVLKRARVLLLENSKSLIVASQWAARLIHSLNSTCHAASAHVAVVG